MLPVSLPNRKRGPRLRAEAPSSVRVKIGLSPAEADLLRRVAAENNQPVSAFVRDCVNLAAAECGERLVFLTLTNRRR
jgi:hypothetical protein